MAAPFENLHFISRSVHQAEDQVAHSVEAVRKMTADVGEGSIKLVREHPVETGATLCLVGFCVKNPAIRGAVQETIDVTSARVAVGLDDAIMAPGYHYNPKEEAFCFGYPGTEKLTGSMKSNVEIPWEGTPLCEKRGQAVIPLNTRCGSSGSPVLNRQGEVTGIVNSGPSYGSLYHSLSVAIPSDRAKALVEGNERSLLTN
jgi:hypothetical protein